jgi:ABC-type transport system substrate-binding protein
MRLKRLLLAAVFALPFAAHAPAQAQGTLRIGMTAADIPLTHGQPDQGFEGNRFTGIPLYNALIEWDLTRSDRATPLVAGLATEWAVDATDKTRWVFKLRPSMTAAPSTPTPWCGTCARCWTARHRISTRARWA